MKIIKSYDPKMGYLIEDSAKYLATSPRKHTSKEQSQKISTKGLQGKPLIEEFPGETPLKELVRQVSQAMVSNLNKHAGK